MARVKLGIGGTYETLNDREWYEQFLSMLLSNESGKHASFDDSSGNQIVMTGKQLDSSNAHNITGTVSEVVIEDSLGRVIFDVTGLSVSYSKLSAAATSTDTYAMLDLLAVLIRGKDRIFGTSGSEELMSTVDKGNDYIKGYGGNDIFRAGPGNNTMLGGSGEDQLIYQTDWWANAKQTRGVDLDAIKGTAVNPWGGHDKISGFEKFRGSYQDDIYRGSAIDEKFALFSGDDFLNGRGGVDTVDYSYDANYGGKNGIIANLKTGKITDAFGDHDTVRHIESILATDYADKLLGSDRNEFFRPFGGDDFLNGRGGSDRFIFSTGFDHDTIAGFTADGANHDIIQFDNISGLADFADLHDNHMVQSGADVILDMGGGDVLLLKNIDMNSLTAYDFYIS